ncbi:hypothetical protein G6L35_26375 [Agrobacterium tumefaciens]|nr:hypothetical protein [Agrobacterium tumefaciens]NSZ72117.1 hypothetical protein [Agrobacterium tumefaciens]
MTNAKTNTDIITIALNKLDRDPKNVRKTYRKGGIEELPPTSVPTDTASCRTSSRARPTSGAASM